MVGNLDGGVTLMWGSLDCAQALWNAAVVSTKPWFLLSISEINIFSLRSPLMKFPVILLCGELGAPPLTFQTWTNPSSELLKDFLNYFGFTQFAIEKGCYSS